MNMHILQLASSYPPAAYGGDASQVEALHHALNSDDSFCTTIYFRLQSEPDAAAKRVMAIASECNLRQIHDDLELQRINKQAVSIALKLPRPPVIHLHTTLFAMAAITLSQLWECPLVYTAHYPAINYLADPERTQNIQRAERLIIEKANIVICVSKWLREQLAATYAAAANKMRVIYNGVDTQAFKPTRVRREFLLFAGRFVPQKGLEYIAPLAKGIQASCALPLVVLGKGSEGPAFRESLSRCVLEHFGSVPANEMPVWLSRAAALLLPSRWDPCPLVALEAMACGVPVLGSDIPGLNELVIDSETGLLSKLDDTFAEHAATRFLALFRNAEAYQAMARRCRERAIAGFSLSRMTKQVVNLYEEVRNKC